MRVERKRFAGDRGLIGIYDWGSICEECSFQSSNTHFHPPSSKRTEHGKKRLDIAKCNRRQLNNIVECCVNPRCLVFAKNARLNLPWTKSIH